MGKYLITGAGGGMGKTLAAALSAKGHNVWGIDLQDTAYEADKQEQPENLRIIKADVTKTEQLENACDIISREAGSLDGIIHLAGIYMLNSLVEMSENDFIKTYDINLFGVFRVNKLFVPLLAPKGRVVIVTSELASVAPMPFTGIYGAAKTALDSYSRTLFMELSLLEHPVIIIRPGAVATGMLPESMAKLDSFCDNTTLYSFSADRFRTIVGKMEGKPIPPGKVAAVIEKALFTKRPKAVYNIHRDPRLVLYSILPQKVRAFVIRKLLS